VKHKTEVFHILDVQSDGYVFICGFEEWSQAYDQDSFSRWLEGHPDKRYDQYRFFPRPGDVFVIDRLGVVHSVIGCVLEEFATVSTDMVDRLYDQNAGKSVPSRYDRSYARDRLTRIPVPSANRHIEILPGQARVTELTPMRIAGGRMIVLARSSMRASRYFIERSRSTDLIVDTICAASLHVAQGKGQVIIGSLDEVERFTPPSCDVIAGDVLMIPPGIYYAFVNEGSDDLIVSEHRIEVEVALV
jgi:mannose-6-phosphate isomerase-like protein (cupin superfamily)